MAPPTFLDFDRRRLLLCLLAPVLALGALLRVVLYASFHDGAFDVPALAGCLAAGLVSDALTALVALAPLVLLLWLFGGRWLARTWLRSGLLGLYCAAVCFAAFVEYFFFEEFNARFNNIALDYVLYPHEVFGNVFESYDVPLFVSLALLVGVAGAVASARALRAASFARLPWKARWKGVAATLSVSALALLGLYALPAQVSVNRITSEIAAGGLVQLVRASWSAGLDYPLYYRTLPPPEARARAARVLGFDRVSGVDGPPEGLTLTKHLAPRRAGASPSQIVIVLEESLGSEFVPALGHAKSSCTPNLERWMADGLTLVNLTATGNRTVRGLEGTLCSFVPLPGDSIVKRDRSENVASLARVLKARGYATAFFYGGYGLFDQMKPFMEANGWDDFFEQPDFPDEAFRTIWGVADEFIFDALLARQKQEQARGGKLFATLLSVSNHKPYRIPAGRVGHPDDKPGRKGAVRYADWCIGRYLDQLRDGGLLDDTLVLILGDHGARVYGAEEIPTESYRIPGLFVTPDASLHGTRIERLCSQIDLAPTLLDLAGLTVDAPFFGESVLALPADGGRAFVHHNREVGILTDDALVVLGLRQQVTYYTRAGRDSDVFTRVAPGAATTRLHALADDAAAVFGTAYELYGNRRLRLPEEQQAPAPPGHP